MTKHGKSFLAILVVAVGFGAWMIHAQNADTGNQVVKEDMVVEDAVAGSGNGQAKAPEAEAKTEEAKPAAELPVEEKAATAPAGSEGTSETKPADKSLEQVVEEIIGESKTNPPAEAKPATGAVETEAAKGTPAAEVMAEPPAAAQTAQESPAAAPAVEPAPAAVVEAAPEKPAVEPAPAAVEAVKEAPAEKAVVVEAAPEKPAEKGTAEPAAEKPLTEQVKEALAEAPAANQGKATEAAPEIPKLEKAAPEVSDPRMAEVIGLKEREELSRKAYESHAMDMLAEGEEALAARKYTDARTAFQEALKTFARVSRKENRAAVAQARAGLQASIYNEAMLKMKDGDYAAAEELAKEAKAEGHPKAGDLLREITRLKEKPAPPPAAPPHRWASDDFKQRDRKIQDRMQAGREYYASGEYDKAKAEFESVLKIDPQNTEAIRWREKTAQRTYSIASDEFASTRKDMTADVRRTWNPRDYGVGEFAGVNPTNLVIEPGRSADAVRRRTILSKMDKIIIPEVDFRQANINDVIDFLEKSSRDFDTSDEENKGVNIILNTGLAAAAPAAAPAEGAKATAEGGAEGQLITFKARDISLMEALRIVTSVANLKYSIQGNVVMIVPLNAPTEPIVHRSYDVLSSVGERIKKITEELPKPAEGNAGRKLGDETAAPAAEGGEMDWKQFFTRLGVPWPDGTSIQYLPSIGKIMVANTAENLAIFEQRLADLNVVPNQIEIEARFVEVQQDDLSSLGFEWLLTDDWELAHNAASAASMPGTGERIIVPANVGSGTTRGGFTSGLRFPTDGLGTIMPGLKNSNAGAVNDSVMTIASVLTNPQMSMVLHLLQQKGNTDMLSAPKVTTQSGVEATIKVVTEYIYPTEFTVTPILASDAQGRMLPVGGIVEPGSFETREVGVILQVMPEVSAEGQMISLTLAPEVVSDPTWKDYGSTFTLPDGSTQTMPMPQPFFQTRSISTSIIIYNDATVVMGGMITEGHNSVDDKIPLLGDIPLLGRFFSSKVDSSKRNLLVFVTARLVDPAGHAAVSAPKGQM